MPKPDKELNEAFSDGYYAIRHASNPALHSSRMWESYELGAFMRASGRPFAIVYPSRGNSWRTDSGTIYRFEYATRGNFTITRQS